MRLIRSLTSPVFRLTLLLLMASSSPGTTAWASDAPRSPAPRVVVDASSGHPEQWDLMLRNLKNLQASFKGGVLIEVVAYGPGLDLLLGTDAQRITDLRDLARAGVTFKACQKTLTQRHLSREALMDFATPTDSGTAEIVRREADGWHYLKPGD